MNSGRTSTSTVTRRSPEKSFSFGHSTTSASGRPSGRIFSLVDGLAVELVEALADGVVEHLAAADALVDDGRRNLALAEAGDVDRLGDVLVRVGDAGLELVGRDRDVSFTRVGLSFSTVVFTMVVLLFIVVPV